MKTLILNPEREIISAMAAVRRNEYMTPTERTKLVLRYQLKYKTILQDTDIVLSREIIIAIQKIINTLNLLVK